MNSKWIYSSVILILLSTGNVMSDSDKVKTQKATFAGGCFWCMEPPFDQMDGVEATIVGYTGGKSKNPTYQEISTGRTGHAEAVQIIFDPAKVSYAELLDVFWTNIDPTTKNRQFADRGSQYRTAIFYHDENQKELALNSKQKLQDSGKFDSPIVTEIAPAGEFYRAEEYHQDYYLKNPEHYNAYRKNSGRVDFFERIWGGDKEAKD